MPLNIDILEISEQEKNDFQMALTLEESNLLFHNLFRNEFSGYDTLINKVQNCK